MAAHSAELPTAFLCWKVVDWEAILIGVVSDVAMGKQLIRDHLRRLESEGEGSDHITRLIIDQVKLGADLDQWSEAIGRWESSDYAKSWTQVCAPRG